MLVNHDRQCIDTIYLLAVNGLECKPNGFCCSVVICRYRVAIIPKLQ